jgi:ATP-dependent helicase HrpA
VGRGTGGEDRVRAVVPSVRYPEELPVSARRQEIMAAISTHQVVVVSGETGSGKTTQLPKMCLELGRGGRGMIGHTQPRRIAARTVAERLAEELEVDLGGAVGYAVRFTDRVGPDTLVKVMTDGILLAEIRRDRTLSGYDTIIVDEAHERSLNIDFLLGYLAQLLPKRPDLKVIITSATIDTERFAAHFNAPIINVSGRMYPVEVRYRAPDDETGDLNSALCQAVAELVATGPGDVLVFLPGERDIRDAADALRQNGPPDLEIIPLYARLSAAEQHRVFKPHRARRVVLATNVAETSLTVPGIGFVVDSGLARISRFSHRTKVQRLPIEPISQASANQRAGRCGRLGPGICIRLYDQDEFASRPEYTDPEILRTNLASVILQMAAIGLGPIEDFPFIEAPDRRSIADGRALLEELGALESRPDGPRLTRIGRRLAELPLDPRLGRMVLEAEKLDCLREVVIITAALSIQDPRERPAEHAQEAADLHRRFEVPDSDFLTYLKLWDHLTALQQELSGNQFRRRCRTEYLHVLRVREWQDVAGQIRQVIRARGCSVNREPAHPDRVHQALLSGLLSHIGMRDRVRADYLGARNSRWSIGRASVLSRRPPPWAMAGELVETERAWARTAARIEPAWAARAGAHLLKRSWSDPWWDRRRGEAMTEERASLFGLPVVSPKSVGLARTDPGEARQWFLERALVKQDWEAEFPPHRITADRTAMVEALEDRVRRRDLLAGEEALMAFYEGAVPATIMSGAALLRWWRSEARSDPEQLAVPLATLVDRRGGPVNLSGYPDRWRQDGLELDLRYRFAPGEDDDGVTVIIPLEVLNRIDAAGFDWHVPGFRPDLVTALVRSLPKPLRRALGPAPEVAASVLSACSPDDGPLLDAVADRIARLAGQPVPPDVWDGIELPRHLMVHFELADRGRVLAGGDDLHSLRSAHHGELLAALHRAFPGWDRSGARSWVFGDLPGVLEHGPVRAFPSLTDEGESVGLTLTCDEPSQAAAMWDGTRRLLRLASPLPEAHIQRRLSNDTKLAVSRAGWSMAALIDDCASAVVDQVIVAGGGPPHSAAGFERLAARLRADLTERAVRLATIAGGALAAADLVRSAADRLASRSGRAYARALRDVRRQVDDLVQPGFVSTVGPGRLRDLLRYLDAAGRRLERLPADPHRDAQRQDVIDGLRHRYEILVDSVAAGAGGASAATAAASIRWMIEELRVSLWAQHLGTPTPISAERIDRALTATGR